MSPDTTAPPCLGGRYQLGDVIGRGGMGDVYRGVDTRLDRVVAVKVLRPAMARQADIRTRFETEALSAARLSHPNVVTVYDSGEDEGVPFIVMECLPGRTLATTMAAGPVDQGWLRHVAGDVLGALGAAHAAGVVHRDVKPGNILLTDDGRAKVADFGIAKSLEPIAGRTFDTTGHLMVGTPAYLAPERVEGEPATPRSDLYSLGVVLYEALAGAKPFTGDTPLAVAMAVVNAEPEPLPQLRPDVDPALAAVVETAMQRDPNARFADAADMQRALGAATATAPPDAEMATLVEQPDQTRVLPAIVASPVPALAAAPAWVRRRRAVLLLAAAVIAVGVALAIAMASSHDRNSVNQPATSDSTPASVTARSVVSTPTTQVSIQVQIPAPSQTVPGRGGRGGGKHRKGNG